MASSDPFDSLLNLEESLLDDAFQDGYSAGKVIGYAEGHALGQVKGGSIGEELGFYCGAAEVIARARRKQLGLAHAGAADSALDGTTSHAGDKVLKVSRIIVDLCMSAPLENPAVPTEETDLGDNVAEDDSERPPQSGESPASVGRQQDLDVFAVLQQVRAKFRLLTALVKLPGLVFDQAVKTGEKERSF